MSDVNAPLHLCPTTLLSLLADQMMFIRGTSHWWSEADDAAAAVTYRNVKTDLTARMR